MDPAQSILDGSCSPLLSAGATCFRISEILTGDMSCSPSFWWSSETGPGSKTKVQACLSEPYCAVSLIFGERRKLSEFGVPSLRITTSVEAPYILRRSSDVGARVVVVATASRQQRRTRIVAQFIILAFGSASRNELVKLLVTPYSYKSSILKDGSRIQRLAEFARIKTNSPGLITPKAGWSIRLSQSKVVWWTRPGSNRRPPHCERGITKAKTRRHNQLAF